MTVQELITGIRRLINDRQAVEFPDDELIGYINDVLRLLSVQLARLRAHLLLTSADISVSAGTTSVSLPSDFMKEESIFWVDSNNQIYALEETGYNAKSESGLPRSYYKDSSAVYLYPAPDTDGTLRVVYYKTIPSVSGLSDTVSLPSYFTELITRAVAMRAKSRVEIDPSMEINLRSFIDSEIKGFLKLYGSWKNAQKMRAV